MIEAYGRHLYLQINESGAKDIYLCESHFFPKDIKSYSVKKSLSPHAIPKANDPLICSCKENNLDPICQRILENGKSFSKENASHSTGKIMKGHAPQTSGAEICKTPADESEEELVVKKCKTDKNYIKDFRLPKSPEMTEIFEWQLPSPKKPICESPGKTVRTVKIPKYVYASSKSGQKIKQEKEGLIIDNLLEGKSAEVQTFVKSQLLHKKLGKWSEKEKKLALKLYYLSPALYRDMLKCGFSLPASSTILKWHSNLRFGTGLSDIMLNMLQLKFEDLNTLNSKCILMFDEMSTKHEFEYNVKDDFVYGFADLSFLGRSNKMSSSTMIFMLRGLNQNWKQGISYLAGSVNAENLTTILQEDLNKLLRIGCDIKGVTCDQAATNRSCYANLGVSKEKSYFLISGKKIYAFFDIPHLFKSVRNCLYTNDIKIEEMTVSWSVIRDVYNFDNGKIRALYKLTDVHIDPKNFDRMSVKLATQILSHSVASAILTAVELGCFEGDKREIALNTAHFISKLNTLFDSLNSVLQFSKNPARCAISLNTENISKILSDGKLYISKWTSLGRMKRPFCFDGLMQTITAVEMLWEDLKSEQKYLITSHLNQDPLENIISMIRGFKGTYERNPSVYRVYRNLKQIMFHSGAPSEHSNYADSASNNLINLPCVKEGGQQQVLGKSCDESALDNLDNDVPIEFYSEVLSEMFTESSPQEKLKNNTLLYFFGYLSKKFSKILKCDSCTDHMISTSPEISSKYLFIKNKSYSSENFGSLTIPSDVFEAELSKIFCVFFELFPMVMWKANILNEHLFPAINVKIPQWKGCNHISLIIKVIIKILVRIERRNINKSLKYKNKSQRLNILKGTE